MLLPARSFKLSNSSQAITILKSQIYAGWRFIRFAENTWIQVFFTLIGQCSDSPYRACWAGKYGKRAKILFGNKSTEKKKKIWFVISFRSRTRLNLCDTQLDHVLFNNPLEQRHNFPIKRAVPGNSARLRLPWGAPRQQQAAQKRSHHYWTTSTKPVHIIFSRMQQMLFSYCSVSYTQMVV